MAKRDYYEVLGLSRGASEAEIKKAYRRLARKLHPDVNPGDKAAQKRFQEVQEAYDVLKDDDKRRAYDRFGHAGPGAGFDPRTAGGAGFPPGGFPGRVSPGGGSPFEGIHFESGDLGDLFGNLFGGRRSTGPEPGEDMRGQIDMPFRDAVLGGTATLALRREKPARPAAARDARARPRARPAAARAWSRSPSACGSRSPRAPRTAGRSACRARAGPALAADRSATST